MSTHEPEPGGYPILRAWQLPLRDRCAGQLPPDPAAPNADAALARARAYQERLEARERNLLAREAKAEGEARTLLAWQKALKAQKAVLRSWRRGLWAWTAGVVVAVFWVLSVCAGTLPAGGRP